MDATLKNLAAITAAIRQVTQKSRLRKTDSSFHPAMLETLGAHLKCMALIRPTPKGKKHARNHENDPLWWEGEMNGELTLIRQRLIDSNLQRRNRFHYAQG